MIFCGKSLAAQMEPARTLAGVFPGQYVKVKCRRRKPQVKDFDIFWPVLSMRSWLKFLFENLPGLCLGGYCLDEDWPQMHEYFWEKWRQKDPGNEIYSSSKPLGFCIPYFTHGDEGQTTRKTAFMVQSFQFAISWMGIDHTTMSGFLA